MKKYYLKGENREITMGNEFTVTESYSNKYGTVTTTLDSILLEDTLPFLVEDGIIEVREEQVKETKKVEKPKKTEDDLFDRPLTVRELFNLLEEWFDGK